MAGGLDMNVSGTIGIGYNVNAAGTLWITNGTVNCSAINVGSGSNSVGTLIVSGATLTWGNDSTHSSMNIGPGNFSSGNTVIVSNNAYLSHANGNLRVGSSSGQ